MAVPTITDVDPATGVAAGGDLIVITGTNFKTPTLVYDIPTPDTITPTVAVTVNGRSAEKVEVISATEVRIRTPRLYRIDFRTDEFDPVDIVLTNLDSNGDAIPGETVTATDAFTYARWVTGAPRQDPPVNRIVKEVLWALMLAVEQNIYRATHVDYGEEGTAVTIAETEIPCINVTMSVIDDPEYGAGGDEHYIEVEQDDGSSNLHDGLTTEAAVLDLLVAGATATEADHMCRAVTDFVRQHPEITVPADPEIYPDEEDSYALEIWRKPNQINNTSTTGMVVYSMELRIRGITSMLSEPFDNVKPWTTATLTTQHIDGDTGEDDGAPVHINLIEP